MDVEGNGFSQGSVSHTHGVVSDGEEALAYLRREGVDTERYPAPPPDVVVLDLPLPLELVQCLKQDPQCHGRSADYWEPQQTRDSGHCAGWDGTAPDA
jgi:CheY-like chemotaxis protein